MRTQGVLGFKVLEYFAEQMWGDGEEYRRRHNAEHPSAPLGWRGRRPNHRYNPGHTSPIASHRYAELTDG